MVTASAADREPPNPSGLARITLVAQILLLSPMQSSLHLHSRDAFVEMQPILRSDRPYVTFLPLINCRDAANPAQ
jgi:hypothetical protein